QTVHFLSFAELLFPQLSQDTLLLLADNKGPSSAEFRWRHLREPSELVALGAYSRVPGARRLDTEAIATGRQRLVEQFISSKARDLYAELRRHKAVRPLAALADVGI